MIAASDTALTLGGFVAIASLGVAAIALAITSASRSADIRERLARLESELADHLRNGTRHERKD